MLIGWYYPRQDRLEWVNGGAVWPGEKLKLTTNNVQNHINSVCFCSNLSETKKGQQYFVLSSMILGVVVPFQPSGFLFKFTMDSVQS